MESLVCTLREIMDYLLTIFVLLNVFFLILAFDWHHFHSFCNFKWLVIIDAFELLSILINWHSFGIVCRKTTALQKALRILSCLIEIWITNFLAYHSWISLYYTWRDLKSLISRLSVLDWFPNDLGCTQISNESLLFVKVIGNIGEFVWRVLWGEFISHWSILLLLRLSLH